MDAGRKLRRFRDERGISQQKVADGIGTTRVAISRWERGVFKPNAPSLVKLAAFMQCSVDELIKEVTE
jgi:transcriptional regulator with XRE-family HTH domain